MDPLQADRAAAPQARILPISRILPRHPPGPVRPGVRFPARAIPDSALRRCA